MQGKQRKLSETKSKNIKVTVESHGSLETFCSKVAVQSELKKMISITDDKIVYLKGEIWRESPTRAPLRLLVGLIIFFQVGKTLFAILIGKLFSSLTKNIVRSYDWLKFICV